MKALFLDTSAYSAFKKGFAPVLEEIREADRLYLNAIVLGELFSGFDKGKFREKNRRELKEFMNFPAVNVASLTEETAERYSLIYLDLRDRGEPISTNDLWIAATVMELGTSLLTLDGDFLKIRQIKTILFKTFS